VLIAAAAIAVAVHDAVGVRNLRFAEYGGKSAAGAGAQNGSNGVIE